MTKYNNILDILSNEDRPHTTEHLKTYIEKKGGEWKEWYVEKAVSPQTVFKDNFHFWEREGTARHEEVPVDKIIGQCHGRYSECNEEGEEPTWYRMLDNCINRLHKHSPVEVSEIIKREDQACRYIYLDKYGENYFISMGKHRSVEAKFLNLEMIPCIVHEYVFRK